MVSNKIVMNKYIYVCNPKHYEVMCKVLLKSPELAGDCETYVLPEWKKKGHSSATDPHTSRISLLTLMGRNTVPIIFDFIKLKKAGFNKQPVWNLLKSRTKLIFANAQFDGKFIKREFGETLENFWCVINMSKLISNASGSKFGRATGHRLADLCRDYLDIKMTGKGQEQVTDWYPRPEDDSQNNHQWFQWLKKLEYAADDVPNLFTLHDLFFQILTNPLPYSELIDYGAHTEPYGFSMKRILELEMDMIAVAIDFEYNGLPVSYEIFTQIQNAIWDKSNNTGRLVEVASELLNIFGRNDLLYDSPWHDYFIPTDAGWKLLNNPAQMRSHINNLVGSKLDTVQSSVLNRLIDLLSQLTKDLSSESTIQESRDQPEKILELVSDHEEDIYRSIEDLEMSAAIEASEICKLVVEYKRLNKQYIMDLRKYINPVTGCIHSHVDLLGAATGRSSSSTPNGQNISGRTFVLIDRPINNLFISSANYDALEPDWSVLSPDKPHIY
jgi:hypothetical protein